MGAAHPSWHALLFVVIHKQLIHISLLTKPHLNHLDKMLAKRVKHVYSIQFRIKNSLGFICVKLKKVFCHMCMNLYKSGSLTLTKKYETAFITDGFNNWKKARERFEQHQMSECHKKALLKLKSMQGPSVIQQLDTQAFCTQATNRSMLLKELSSLKLLLKQGLAICGHNEN